MILNFFYRGDFISSYDRPYRMRWGFKFFRRRWGESQFALISRGFLMNFIFRADRQIDLYSYPQKSDSKLNKFFYTKFAVYDKEKINISI